MNIHEHVSWYTNTEVSLAYILNEIAGYSVCTPLILLENAKSLYKAVGPI